MPRNRVHKRSDGRYTYAATDLTGKVQRLQSRKGETRADFAKRCDLLDDDCARFGGSSLTLNELFDFWLDQHVKPNLSPSEMRSTVPIYESRIKPWLGRRKATEITQSDVYQILTRAASEGLSASYISKIRGCFSRPYNWANNTLNLSLPVPTQSLRFKMSTKSREESSAAPDRIISDGDLERFFAAAAGTKYFNYFVLLDECGLRPSEGLGLKASDLDFKAGLIRLRRAITSDGESPLKNDTARRDVPMTDRARSALSHQLRMTAFANPDKWLFASGAGAPNMEAVRQSLRHILMSTADWQRGGRNGLVKIAMLRPPVKIRLYDFRHTFATRMVERGIDTKTLQSIMGHRQIETTLKYYVGVTDKMMERARAVMNGQTV